MEEKNIGNEINYYRIKEMEEHAKKYEEAFDKKDFLKNVSAYEQKIILLDSKNPYEVLNYLDELDLKNSRQLLNELSYDEIKRILALFSSEDKQRFYRTYSNLSLVNQFIIHDELSSNYIKDLSFDRKVELIDSSNKDTVIASAKIYETMPEEEKSEVSNIITSSDSISVFSEVSDYVETNVEVIENSSDIEQNKNVNVEETELTKIEQEKTEELEEETIEEETIEEEKIEQEKIEIKNNEQPQITKKENGIAEINLNKNDTLTNNDLIVSKIENALEETLLQEFKRANQQVEQDEIYKINQIIIKQSINQNDEKENNKNILK